MPFFQIPNACVRIRLWAFASAAIGLSGAARAETDAPPAMGWSGEIALGGSVPTGNTNRQALDLEAHAKFNTEHR